MKNVQAVSVPSAAPEAAAASPSSITDDYAGACSHILHHTGLIPPVFLVCSRYYSHLLGLRPLFCAVIAAAAGISVSGPPKPSVRPANPSFGSGPTKKRPGWSVQALAGEWDSSRSTDPSNEIRAHL